jgi:hypothetical protein
MNHFPLKLKRVFFIFIYLITIPVSSAQLPADTLQLIFGIAPSKNSSHVTLSMFEKNGVGWLKSGAAWRGRLGKNGLAWGIGLHPENRAGLKKKKAMVARQLGYLGSALSLASHSAMLLSSKSSPPSPTKSSPLETSGWKTLNHHIITGISSFLISQKRSGKKRLRCAKETTHTHSNSSSATTKELLNNVLPPMQAALFSSTSGEAAAARPQPVAPPCMKLS